MRMKSIILSLGLLIPAGTCWVRKRLNLKIIMPDLSEPSTA